MSHFIFQCAITIAWINPLHYWPKGGSYLEGDMKSEAEGSVVDGERSIATARVLKSFQRVTAFSGKTLLSNGTLSCRLGISVYHLPIPNKINYPIFSFINGKQRKQWNQISHVRS